MWKAAKAAYARAYEDAMKKMRKENEEAFEYLWKTFPARYWSKSWFTLDSKCDVLLNNM